MRTTLFAIPIAVACAISGCTSSRPSYWPETVRASKPSADSQSALAPAPGSSLSQRVDSSGASVLSTQTEQEVIATYKFEFAPQDTQDVVAIRYFADTDGLDWWPGHCGPQSGYLGCPDYLRMFGREQQAIGIELMGFHFVTRFRSDGRRDTGEEFLFSAEDDPEKFRMAIQSLRDGRVYVQLRTFNANLPIQIAMTIELFREPAP